MNEKQQIKLTDNSFGAFSSFINQYQRIESMLSERKRFNYMANTPSGNSSHRQSFNSSALKGSQANYREEPHSYQGRQDKENMKKTDELEKMNKKLVDQTAKQFKKLENDVQRVEKILEDKEAVLEQRDKENQALRQELHRVNEQKKVIIEAIFQKDIVIKEYEAKVNQFLAEKQTQKTFESRIIIKAEQTNTCMQTEQIPQTKAKTEVAASLRRNLELEEEVFKLKEELFDANNKVKVLTQQFEAYKILREIESIQES